MICVITADIINSTKIGAESRDELVKILQRIEVSLQKISQVRIEMYRGDSFQVLIPDAGKGMVCALLIRAGLMAFAPEGEMWDARLSLGIGSVSYENDRITMSDGEAYRLSGRSFDGIGKKRLSVATPSEMINQELALSCAFADDIICGWSKKQADLIFKVLLDNLSRKEIATMNGTSVQNIGKTLRKAKEYLVIMFLDRYETLINQQ
ncbi:MAG: hypothetical protein MJY69_02785 [Bacteroidales bacterium]|nr:hypothetical protein [Bacteroidales bacterium]